MAMSDLWLESIQKGNRERLTRSRRWWRRCSIVLAILPLLVVLLVPLIALLVRVSPADLLANTMTREVTQAIGLSVSTSLISTCITFVTGTPVAYLLARYPFRGRTILDTLIDLPMVLPPSVAGIALLVAFGRRGLLGQYFSEFGIEIAFTQTAVVLAQTFVAAPFYIKAAASGFASIDRDYELAAALDGASPRKVFRYITMPLAGPILFGGTVMTWARALGEFGATIIFAGNFPGRTQTMPLAIYLGFELDLGIALTLSVILLIISFTVLLFVKHILRQHMSNHSNH